MVRCVRVERKNAEKTRQKLAKAELFDGSYIPERDEKFVYFALKDKPPAKLKLKAIEHPLQKREEFGKPLRQELIGKLTKKEAEELVASFDMVGDIAVLEIPPALVRKQALIAAIIFKNHHNIRVVAKKIGGTRGEFRIRPVRVIAGEKRTHTVYREGGCEFELDLNKTYFSSRLGTERGRIAALVKKGEHILIPFAGVGPFAIRIGKTVPSATVVGIELNPAAAKYFEKNIVRNRCENISAALGDVAKLLPGKFKGWADRAAMPLPKDGTGFLPCIIPCLKKGGVLHYYSFGDSRQPYAEAERQVKDAAAKAGRRAGVLFRRVVRPYSKETVQVVIDAKIL